MPAHDHGARLHAILAPHWLERTDSCWPIQSYPRTKGVKRPHPSSTASQRLGIVHCQRRFAERSWRGCLFPGSIGKSAWKSVSAALMIGSEPVLVPRGGNLQMNGNVFCPASLWLEETARLNRGL